jgi:UDP-glucuronate 4-epimerase
MTIIVTGSAGFIGYHVAKELILNNEKVIGIDNFNDYYDPALKEARWNILEQNHNFDGFRIDISNVNNLYNIFEKYKPKKVVHLAAQAGVRNGYNNPQIYTKSNLEGMINILDCCAQMKIDHLVYASSSAIYGDSQKIPFSENNNIGKPLSIYASTKQSNESMAFAFSNLYSIPTTSLRLFTVYGPWGRPDMAIFNFTASILKNQEITLYDNGKMKRDFTYIDDTVIGILKSLELIPKKNDDHPAYNTFNIGYGEPIEIIDLVRILEKKLNKKSKLKFKKSYYGEMKNTWSDISRIKKQTNYKPQFSLEEGVELFIKWFKNFYKI